MAETTNQAETPLRPAGSPVQLPSLTGMRFVAALLVFCSHIAAENLFASTTAQSVTSKMFLQAGFTGVGFFFVLSGFVLAWSARPVDSARRFWRRRFFKIYPNHLVTFLAAAVMFAFIPGQPFNLGLALTNLGLVHAWVPVPPSFNIVSWSLSCEALFYLLFPWLFRLVSRIRPGRLWWYAGVVVGGMLLLPLVAGVLPQEPKLEPGNMPLMQFWLVYWWAFARLLDFLFGILLARIVMTGQRIPVSLGTALVLAVVAYVIAPYAPLTYRLVAVTVVPLGLVIAAGAVADSRRRSTPFAHRRMVWLGEISYAFYLVHWLVLTLGVHLLGKNWTVPGGLGVAALLLGVCVLLSWVLYATVERPMMRRFANPRGTFADPRGPEAQPEHAEVDAPPAPLSDQPASAPSA